MFHVKHSEITPAEGHVSRETSVDIHPLSTGGTYNVSVHPNTTEQENTPS
jgi:hypothetical protein